ncbi:MAG: hypothetical protein EA428_13290 [Spirochaetaceae bacterium]|nr:MAG: hypothetical protein EA428_13290 [Spirochaetaceae bacterium]
MTTPHVELRERLLGSLTHVVNRSEEIFLDIGRTFPRLMGEMRRSLDNSASLVAGISGEAQTSSRTASRTELVEDIIADTQNDIAIAGDRFQKMHAADTELFRELDANIEKLTHLEARIEAIREDSIEMELVSLNAMTVALKSGTAGRAFSHITDELKHISMLTIQRTEEVTKHGEGLLETFTTFRTTLGEAGSFHEELFGEFRERLNASFKRFSEGVTNTVSALSSIRSRSEEVKAPLALIMQEVQVQDLIKQSIDHVVISLNELEDISDTGTEDQKLDELAFLRAIPDLCDGVLEDVQQKLTHSISVFRENIEQAEHSMDAAEQKRKQFVSHGLDHDSEEGQSLQGLFDESSRMVEKLIGDLDRSLELKENINKRSINLLEELHQLEESFHTFDVVVSRFRSVDIASRIEVAKQVVLQQMSSTVDEMTKLTQKIEQDVDDSLSFTKQFIKQTNSIIRRFQELSTAEEPFVRSFQSDIRDSYQRLNDAKTHIESSISGFSLFTESFFDEFQAAVGQLGELEDLAEEVSSVRIQLREVREKATAQMAPILESRGLSEWKLEDQRLRTIIDRFTIFTHKKVAGELGGFDVEVGTDSGEFTLF